MVAKLDLKIQVDKQSLAEALKKIEIDEMIGVFYALAVFYIASGPPGSPLKKFGEALDKSLDIINQGDF